MEAAWALRRPLAQTGRLPGARHPYRPLALRRLAAQDLSQRRHRAVGVRPLPRRVHLVMRVASLFRERHLRGDARAGVRFGETVALHQPDELQLRRTVHHHQAREAQVHARLYEERRLRDQEGLAHRGRAAGGLLAHARMHERLQAAARARIGEDDLGQRLAIDGAVRGEDAGRRPAPRPCRRPPGRMTS